MQHTLGDWLFDPTVGRLIAAVAGVLVVVALVRLAQRTLSRYVKDSDVRYRSRKFLSFAGYLLGLLLVATVYSDRLGGLTVAFGVAGAGIAFAGKVDDGNQRGLLPVAVEVLDRLGHVTPSARDGVREFVDPVIRNAAGLEVGEQRLAPIEV